MPDDPYAFEREEWCNARDQDVFSAPTEDELLRPPRDEAEEGKW